MLKVAYLANRYPSPVEPYVGEEIAELRRRGVAVVTGSVRRARTSGAFGNQPEAEIELLPLQLAVMLRALWLCVSQWRRIAPLISRIVLRGNEGPVQRVKALAHTWLGACYAVKLQKHRIEHIHVHHGYFGSWVAMVAAKLLDVGFSMTLHGSDVLLRAAYLDAKLAHCSFCLTISEYNRRYILQRYPNVEADKVIVSRLGVDVSDRVRSQRPAPRAGLTLLAVGRLHAVKNHAFLVRACAELHTRGIDFECSIAGDGPERRSLEALIRRCGVEDRVTLLGHIESEQIDSLYNRADVVVLTSHSEGIPLVLMEAMARRKIVLAPAITGIPELVIPGKTGFLYESGSMGDFVARLLLIHSLLQSERRPDRSQVHPFVLSAARQLDWLRHAAHVQVRNNFNRTKNLQSFADLFLRRVVPPESSPHEDSVLQQIQPPVQRHRSVPVRVDGVDAFAGARSSAVLDD